MGRVRCSLGSSNFKRTHMQTIFQYLQNISVKALYLDITPVVARQIVQVTFLFAGYVVLKVFSRAVSYDMLFGSPAVSVAYFAVAALCFFVAYAPDYLWSRVLASLGFLAVTGYAVVQPEKTDQSLLLLTYTLILFASVYHHAQFSRAITVAQLVILSTYTLSGVAKLVGTFSACGIYLNACDGGAFSRIIAQNFVDTGRFGPLTEFLVAHHTTSMLGFFAVSLFQVGILLFFVYGFKKSVGLELGLFHVFIYLAMGITFIENIVVIFLLFILPYQRPPQASAICDTRL